MEPGVSKLPFRTARLPTQETGSWTFTAFDGCLNDLHEGHFERRHQEEP